MLLKSKREKRIVKPYQNTYQTQSITENLFKSNLETINKNYNFLTKLIKIELKAYREKLWLDFCYSLNTSKKNSGEYWDKIKFIGSLVSIKKKRKTIILQLNSNGFTSNLEKAELFGRTLKKKVFYNESSSYFDNENLNLVQSFLKNKTNDDLFVSNKKDKKITILLIQTIIVLSASLDVQGN